MYLYTKVRKQTVSDYGKLIRLIKNLRATMYFLLVIGWNEPGTLLWSFDDSFSVHNNMKSHTSAMLTFGKKAVSFMTNKQKVNSTSSAVAEIVSVNRAMNYVM